MTQVIETSLSALTAAMAEARRAVLDFETSDVRPRLAIIAGLGVLLPDLDRLFYINVGHCLRDPDFPRYSEPELADVLRSFLADRSRQMLAHNAVYELRLLMRLGLDIRCRVSCTLIRAHRVDENLRSYGGEPTYHYHLPQVTYGLKELSVVYFNRRPPTLHDTIGDRNTIYAPVADVARYCALDVLNTWDLNQRTEGILIADRRLRNLVRRIDDPNNVVLAKMMAAGVPVDEAEMLQQRDGYERAIRACREEIWRIANVNWPLETARDVRRLLRHLDLQESFEDFEPSVATEVLEDIYVGCDSPEKQKVIALLLSKSNMEQRINAFLKPGLRRIMYSDGRLYADRFGSTLTTTRFSSSPNLQNLPKKADKAEDWCVCLSDECRESFKTRNVYRAAPGSVFVSADLKAAEPRYMACLFQRALREKDEWYRQRRRELRLERESRWPTLVDAMKATQILGDYKQVEISWPTYPEDPLWRVFKYGQPFDDPYNALLATIDKEGYKQAQAAGNAGVWLADNRWRGKRAWLALAYGSGAQTLAPQLGWSAERTTRAIESLFGEYATLRPLQHLAMLEMIHLGEVRNLWGRPRRINGYYQLAGSEPVTIQFYRMRPTRRTYRAKIIPLGSIQQGVQAFVEKCWLLDDKEETGSLVLAGNPDGTIQYIDQRDAVVRSDQFNKPPFRNINFSQVDWVEDQFGLKRLLPKQNRGLRQAFNAMCQSTGADHLRWLMNRVDKKVCRCKRFQDCRLILTMHDSLIYEVPSEKAESFVKAISPILKTRPWWADIDIEIEVEVGERFGELQVVPAA